MSGGAAPTGCHQNALQPAGGVLLLLLLLACDAGAVALSGYLDDAVAVEIAHDGSVRMTLSGPTGGWFSFAFAVFLPSAGGAAGAQRMEGAYAIVCRGPSIFDVEEWLLTASGMGTRMRAEFVVKNVASSNDTRTVTLTGPRVSQAGHYKLPDSAGNLTLLHAWQAGGSVAYHGSNRQVMLLQLVEDATKPLPETDVPATLVPEGGSGGSFPLAVVIAAVAGFIVVVVTLVVCYTKRKQSEAPAETMTWMELQSRERDIRRLYEEADKIRGIPRNGSGRSSLNSTRGDGPGTPAAMFPQNGSFAYHPIPGALK